MFMGTNNDWNAKHVYIVFSHCFATVHDFQSCSDNIYDQLFLYPHSLNPSNKLYQTYLVLLYQPAGIPFLSLLFII